MSSRLPNAPSPWPHRLAWATALCAVPLVLFGGSVTTLGAGLAVDGWLVAEGHFLLVFPVEKWFRDLPTFVEHTHRLFGVLVGLGTLALLGVALLHERRLVALALAGLLAVSLQGTLGGLRVLERSPELAFLHGALAQGVFALLCAIVVVSSPRWRAAAGAAPTTGLPRRLARVAVGGVVLAVTLGAWYRHALRPEPQAGAAERFHLHLLAALAVFALVATLATRLREAHALEGARRRLMLLLGAQAVLGFTAWAGYRPESVGALEWLCSILHVLIGAGILAQTVAIALWIGRLSSTRSAPVPAPEPRLEGGLG